MTPDDLALLIQLGLVERCSATEYRLTGNGRILAGEIGNVAPVEHTQQWRDGLAAAREKRPATQLRRIK